MKMPLKRLCLIITSLFISTLYLPVALARPVYGTNNNSDREPFKPIAVKSVYDSLQLDLSGLNRQAFENAIKGWDKLKSQGKLVNQSILAIADFSQSSNKKRLFVLDMENYRILFNTLVAHGRNSGREWATRFSNRMSSNQSSPGFYVTGNTYMGSNGYSLKLDGMEKGINDKALTRAIVIHGANYVNESFIASQGYIGRSQGCPAVPAKEAREIIDALKMGACLYIHVPDKQYLSRSVMLKDSSRV